MAWAALLGVAGARPLRAGDINWQDDAAVRQLVQKLADADFAVREDAQIEVGAVHQPQRLDNRVLTAGGQMLHHPRENVLL